MWGVLWVAACIAASFITLVGRLSPKLSLIEIAAASVPVGIIAPAWIVYLLACCTSAIGPHTITVGSLFILYVAASHWAAYKARIGPALAVALGRPGSKNVDSGAPGGYGGRLDTAIVAGLLTVGTALLWPLYSSRMIPEHDGKVWSGGSCWADLPIHMHIAEAFLVGRNKDVSWGHMQSPVFAGEYMAYPFLPDFHAAVMVKLGCNLRWAFLSTGFTLALSFLVLLYSFSLRVTRSRLGSLLALVIMLCTGGMGGINLALRDGFWNALTQDTAQNDVTGDGKIVWFAFLPHVLLPQRGANFAYPAVLFILSLVWKATDFTESAATGLFRKAGERGELLLLAAGLAAGLPLVQAHSFLGLGVIIGTVFLLDAHKWLAQPRLLLEWAKAGLLALCLAYPQMRLFKHQQESGAGGKFTQVGWWYSNHDLGRPEGITGFFRFWHYANGPAFPLFLLGLGLLLWEVVQAGRLALRVRSEKPGTLLYAAPLLEGVGRRGRALPRTREAGSDSDADDTASAADGSGVDASSGSSSSVSEAAVAARAQLHARHANAARRTALPGSAAALGSTGSLPLRPSASPSMPAAAVADVTDGGVTPRLVSWEGGKETYGWNSGSSGNLREGETYLLAHLWAAAKESLHSDLGIDLDALLEADRYAWNKPDSVLSLLNRLSIRGRSLDALKLGLAALAVFLLGNYVNFQPWDRDNAKLFYLYIFVASCFTGALLAAPVEALLEPLSRAVGSGVAPGFPLVLALLNPLSTTAYARSLWLARGAETTAAAAAPPSSAAGGAAPAAAAAYASCMPPEAFPEGSRTLAPGTAAVGADTSPEGKEASRRAQGVKHSRTGARLEVSPAPGTAIPRTIGVLGLGLCTLPALVLLCTTGAMMIAREFGLYHVLLDQEQADMGQYIRAHVPPKAVILHRDIHITPAGCLAGRPSLVAYNGWMWSHGYNYHDRDRDRSYVLENALKDSDPNAYNAARRWGVRYVLGEYIQRHHRPSQLAHDEALAKRREDPNYPVPPYDPNLFLDGQLKRIHTAGRYELFEVQGYGFPPT